MKALRLPPRFLVPRFGDTECDDLTQLVYHPISGLVYRHRYRMVLKLLAQTGRVERLLEAGNGAGMLLPSLRRMTCAVSGIDIHAHQEEVNQMLRAMKIDDVELFRADIRQLPFVRRAFSHIVSVSVLEHLRDLAAAFQELYRVTKPEGWLIVGVPVKNWITRRLFAAVGYDDDEIHPSSHREILRAAAPYWVVRRMRVLPIGVPLDLSLYMTVQFQARPGSDRGH